MPSKAAIAAAAALLGLAVCGAQAPSSTAWRRVLHPRQIIMAGTIAAPPFPVGAVIAERSFMGCRLSTTRAGLPAR